ncbi:MAG: NAD(P)-dependent oxidoreductase [bacterium]|nr:NAD(P)-dependent oxidoreductase [bacterium]
MISFKSNKPVANTVSASNSLNSKILITGAENSLARFLAYGLLDAGAQVSVQAVSLDTYLALKSNFPAVQHSFADPRFAEMIGTLAPDIILHASTESSRDSSAQAPLAAFNRIVEKTAVLCDVVRRNSASTRVVLMSSTDVYGECAVAMNESAALDPVSMNGRYFAMAEEILQDFERCYDLKATILRIASTYGPAVGTNPVHDLLFNLLGPQGTNIKYHFEPNATRDIIHAADVLQAVKLVLSNPTEAIYNIASGHSMTMGELNTHLCSILELPNMGSCASPTFIEATHQHFDANRITSLGFRPQVPLIEGLRGYAAWWSGMKAA